MTVRFTLASTNARVDSLEAKMDQVLAILQGGPVQAAPSTGVACVSCGKAMLANRCCADCARKAGLTRTGRRQPNLKTLTAEVYAAHKAAFLAETEATPAPVVQPLAHLDVAAPAKRGRTAADHCAVEGCSLFVKADHSFCANHGRVTTPAMRRLAQRGI